MPFPPQNTRTYTKTFFNPQTTQKEVTSSIYIKPIQKTKNEEKI